MAASNFSRALAAVWQFDGVKADEAPGENFITTWGVTAATWELAVRKGVVSGSQQNATVAQCQLILFALYWDQCKCEELPTGVDLMVFDFAMLAGQSAAIKGLQRAVGTEQDGILGPVTLAAAAKRGDDVIYAVYNGNIEHLSTLDNWVTFGYGWTRREDYMHALALQWVAPTPKPTAVVTA